MKIAQIAPLHESVPPRLYGGTERVVAFLTDELVRQGHEVTLFASGDSRTRARLAPVIDAALRLDRVPPDPLSAHVLLLEQVLQRADEFDVLHFHIDYLHFPVLRRLAVPHLTTLHGRLDLPGLDRLYREYRDMPVVSISDSQRSPLPAAGWIGTVYNGLPESLLPFDPRGGDYLAFLGRMSPEKGPETAIRIAVTSGLPLRMAAKVDPVDQAYFDQRIRPWLDHPGIEFVGEIDEREKARFLGRARALLFPIDWPEPFGLVMTEAMACGTPVIAFRRGSVPEVMADGVTGFVVDSLDEAVAAVGRIGTIRRRDCRRHFEQHFSARRMARDYLALYEQVRARQLQPRLAS